MGSKEFSQLIVWQKAHQVRLAVYDATEKPPLSRIFRLVDEMQTAALSILGNIAEGFGRRHPKDKAKFYTIAKGSADELKDQLIFTRDKGYWRDKPGHSGQARGSLQDASEPDREDACGRLGWTVGSARP